MEKIVEMRRVYKYFGGLCAVNDVSIELNSGEVLGLVGDNAAGKSTLMKILSGVHEPSGGEILIQGKPVTFRSPHDARDLGIETLYQDLALVPVFNVADNLFLGKELPRKVLGTRLLLNRRAMRQKSEVFLEELGIHIDSVRERVRNLSGGQQQSVAIARTMFFNAKLVILDEPTAAISVKETRRVLNLILQLKQRGISVIVVSHRMDDIFSVSDRIVVMRRGRKVEDVATKATSPDTIIRKIIGADLEPMAEQP
jgi:ABC-type sugar transport system ATPase subunit